jgi:hypothetical protein
MIASAEKRNPTRFVGKLFLFTAILVSHLNQKGIIVSLIGIADWRALYAAAWSYAR